MKKRRPDKGSPTHFEQIPVSVVKKIVEPRAPVKPAPSRNVIVEPASTKTEPYSMSLIRTVAPNLQATSSFERTASLAFSALLP